MDDNVLNNGEPIVMIPVVKQDKRKPTRKVKQPKDVKSNQYIPEIGCYFVDDVEGVVKIPTYGSSNSACFDIYAYMDIDTEIVVYNERNHKKPKKPYMIRDDDGNLVLSFVLQPGDRALISTGMIFAIPDGYSIRLHPRSGLALKEFVGLANSEGVIDDDYVDETYAMLVNESEKQYVIRLGDRLCQGEVVKNQQNTFKQIKTKPLKKSTRSGGFGHTGIK